MSRSSQTALELFELAAIFWRHADEIDNPSGQDRMRNAAAEIEARARLVAQGDRDQSQSTTCDLFAPINLSV